MADITEIKGKLQINHQGKIQFISDDNESLLLITGFGKVPFPLARNVQMELEIYGPSMNGGVKLVRIRK